MGPRRNEPLYAQYPVPMTQRVVRGPFWRAEGPSDVALGSLPRCPPSGRDRCPHCLERQRLADLLRDGLGGGRGKQLGRVERDVLLMSAPWQRELGGMMLRPWTPLLAEDSTTSTQTAMRAAASRICAAGLISLRRGTHGDTEMFLRGAYASGERARPSRGVVDPLRRRLAHARWSRRTLLGEGIVILYRDVLEIPGRRLRWDARLDEALIGAHLRCLCRQTRPFDPNRDLDIVDLYRADEMPRW